MTLAAHGPDPVAPPAGASIEEEPTMRVFVAGLSRAEQAAQLLMRAGFHVAGNLGTEEATSGLVAFDKDGGAPDPTLPETAEATVSRADLAVRVTRAAECLDDPTTTLMANLDTLQADLLAGGLRPDDGLELVSDCVDAVRQLLEGVQRLKAVAAPPPLVHHGASELDLVLRDVLTRSQRSGPVPIDMPAVDGTRVLGARPELCQALSNVLEVFVERFRRSASTAIRVTTYMTPDQVHVCVEDDGPDLAMDFGPLLAGGVRAQSLDGLALMAASSLLDAVGGSVRIVDHGAHACVELTLVRTDHR